MAKQILMFPTTVELTLFQVGIVENHQEELDKMGFTIREFGGNTYIVEAVPALGGRIDPTELLQDILEQFGSEQSKNDMGIQLDTILATMACKAAVKAGTSLSLQEIEGLLNEMAKADMFTHCPHGRPVVRTFSRDELKKWFSRT